MNVLYTLMVNIWASVSLEWQEFPKTQAHPQREGTQDSTLPPGPRGVSLGTISKSPASPLTVRKMHVGGDRNVFALETLIPLLIS